MVLSSNEITVVRYRGSPIPMAVDCYKTQSGHRLQQKPVRVILNIFSVQISTMMARYSRVNDHLDVTML